VVYPGSVDAATCTFHGTTTCFKVHLNAMTGNLTDLTRMQGAALDAALTDYTRRFSAAFQCFLPSEKQCANAQEKQFIDRVQSSTDLVVKELTNKTALSAIVTAYKCHNVDNFSLCLSKEMRDFLSEPLKASKADIKKLCSNVDAVPKRCLVAKNCTAAAEPGKKAARKLFTSFKSIWGCNKAPAGTSALAMVSMMVVAPVLARKML
ncbi:unnamed protein product, partial [Ixodes hexagonus]